MLRFSSKVLLFALLPAAAFSATLDIDLTVPAPPLTANPPAGAEPAAARDQIRLLASRRLFLPDFAGPLARMPVYHPEQSPAGDTLSWDVRSNGTSGFLFYSNGRQSPAQKGVQFQLKTAAGTVIIPRVPITIPPGGQGVLPFNMDCDGVTLRYAAAQPLCRVMTDGVPVYFYSQLDGILPDLVFSGNVNHISDVIGADASQDEVRGLEAGVNAAAWVIKQHGGAVGFVVLTPAQTRLAWRASLGGQDRLILTTATVVSDGAGVRLQSANPDDLAFAMFPGVRSVMMGGVAIPGTKDWIFRKYSPTPDQAKAMARTGAASDQVELSIAAQ